MNTQIEKPPEAKILSIEMIPGAPSVYNFDKTTKGLDAVILVGYATGATHEELNPIIKQRTAEGIPVFVVSSNYKAQNGILDSGKYESLSLAQEAGAIHLQSLNINFINEVVKAIREAFSKGKKGIELGQIIQQQFSLP